MSDIHHGHFWTSRDAGGSFLLTAQQLGRGPRDTDYPRNERVTVPDGAVGGGDSRSLAAYRKRVLTCARAGQRGLPSSFPS